MTALVSLIAACMDPPPPASEDPSEVSSEASAVQASSLTGDAISPRDNGVGCGYVCSTNAVTGYSSMACARNCPGGFANCSVQPRPCP